MKRRFSPHHLLLAQKALLYVGIVLVICTVLIHLKVNLTAVLGAAGIVTVAIGFAAQTSLSNLISGLFLLGERPFEVGDVIVVGTTRGVVLSIDLLSVKLRTLDNLFVRMPNETLIKAEVTTVTRFPIRRMDINIGVAYKEDVQTVIRVLKEVADANPDSLNEPVPLILFKDFGPSSLDFLVGIWFEKTKFLDLKNSIMREIKERFDKEGIEIAFPHLTVYAGTDTPAFPIKVSQEEQHSPDGATTQP
jgi:small-conductance mechanosensitive channel